VFDKTFNRKGVVESISDDRGGDKSEGTMLELFLCPIWPISLVAIGSGTDGITLVDNA
jgi:hypothetical protein